MELQESFISSPEELTPAFIQEKINVYLADARLIEPERVKIGNYSFVLDFGHSIIRMPRNETGLERLVKEEILCKRFRRSPLQIPYHKVVHGPFPFAFHAKIKGVHLTPDHYEALDENKKQDIAQRLADFFMTLHKIPTDAARSMGLEALSHYTLPRTMESNAGQVVKGPMRAHFCSFLDVYKNFKAFEGKRVVGHFDAKGNNMAFCPESGTLMGLYDFADAGIADIHQEFAPLNTISVDLTKRVIEIYTAETGADISLERVNFYSTLIYYSALFENYLRMRRAAEMEKDFAHIEALQYGTGAL